MRRQLYSVVPIMGLLALTYPVSASAPGIANGPALGQSQLPLVLAQRHGGHGGPSVGGAAGHSGGPAMGGASRGGPSMGGASRGGPSMSRGSDGGSRSMGRSLNHSRGDGQRNAVGRGNHDGDHNRVERRGGNDHGRVEHRGDKDRGRVERHGDHKGKAIIRNRGGHDRDYIRRRGHRYVWGPGIEFWFYDGYYYGDCAWLKRRAIATGSSYWWRRYRQCRAW